MNVEYLKQGDNEIPSNDMLHQASAATTIVAIRISLGWNGTLNFADRMPCHRFYVVQSCRYIQSTDF
jgi:hypothetical protein